MGVFLCKALTSKRLLRPPTALTTALYTLCGTKCGAKAKALMQSPFVYFNSLHINSQQLGIKRCASL